MTRPSRLDTPLPGSRCPACWIAREPAPGAGCVWVCDRCFALAVTLAPGQQQRLAPVDLVRLQPADRHALLEQRQRMIMCASAAWRALPRQAPRAFQPR